MLLDDDFTRHLPGPERGGDSETRRERDDQPDDAGDQAVPRMQGAQTNHFQIMPAGPHDCHGVKIRILIAEDHALVRRGTAMLLSTEPDMELVGQARDGLEAVALAEKLRPDLVLMDLNMPRLGGIAATREIARLVPGTQFLVLTTLQDDESVFEAVRAGAHGYLLKDVSEQELLDTIRALRRGESRLTPQIARKVMDQFRRLAEAAERGADGGTQRKAVTVPADKLSEKEEKVLCLIAEGLSNRQIGSALFLAEGTIKNYVSRIMEKLHASTRTELALISGQRRI